MASIPITLKDIKENPTAALLYATLFALVALYADSKIANKNLIKDKMQTIKECKEEVRNCNIKADFYAESKRRTDSTIADMRATLRTLAEAKNQTQ